MIDSCGSVHSVHALCCAMVNHTKLMKGKALRKHSLHEKIHAYIYAYSLDCFSDFFSVKKNTLLNITMTDQQMTK